MEILCADQRLNISPAYLRPGFAYGGSCLPKDLRALRHHARTHDLVTPVLDATEAANQVQIDRAFQMVEAAGKRRVAMIGLSFKSDTDDLRESPMVILAERLIGRGYEVRIFDPNIRMSRLTGTNKAYVTGALPHISQLLCERLEDAAEHGDTLVLAHRSEGQRVLAAQLQNKAIIDLVRVQPNLRSGGNYQGIAW